MVVRALASSVVLRQAGEQEEGVWEGARLHAYHSKDRLQKCTWCGGSNQEVAIVSAISLCFTSTPLGRT